MTKRAEAIKTVRDMGDDELRDHVVAQRRKLFEMRFQQATGQVEDHRQLRYIRREIARAMTIEGQNRRTPLTVPGETEGRGAAPAEEAATATRESRRRGPSLRRRTAVRAEADEPETPQEEPDEADVSLSEVEPGADADPTEGDEGDSDE